MRLRHLLTTAAVAALAVSPLAFSGAAAGAYDAHSYTYSDGPDEVKPNAVIDISQVHLYRTKAGDFRAVVTYKDLYRRPSTRWMVSFDGYNADDETGFTQRFYGVEFRIGPDNKTATFAYRASGIADRGRGTPQVSSPTKDSCGPVSAKPDYTADTITFAFVKKCWPINLDRVDVAALTRLYPAGTWTSAFQSYYDEAGSRADQAESPETWSWGGEAPFRQAPKHDLDDNPFYRH